MKLRQPTDKKGRISLRLLLGIALGLIPIVLLAQGPQWWIDRGVKTSNSSANDYAAANQGQLKNIATAAADELDARLPGGAGDALHTLVNRWSTLQTDGTSRLPNPGTTTNDYAAVNLGQLKTVAAPFFDRLLLTGYQGHPLESGTYPWISGSANDYAMANIGQVKNLFSFAPQSSTPPPIAQDSALSVANDAVLNITLQASAPSGGALSYEIVSGPSHGTLSGAGQQIQYRATSTYAGPDTFRFKANDGTQDSNTATVTLLVKGVPRVSAGPNQTIVLSASATLNGTVIDLDTPASQLSYSWTKRSGPGIVTFAESTLPQTTATFSAPGIYQLMLIASDGQFSRASIVGIQVNPETTTPPTVCLTAPAAGTVFTQPCTIVLSASASFENGVKVEFYQGAQKVGDSSTPPFTFEWQNAPVGSYSITARAIGGGAQGAATFSAPVTIQVINSNGDDDSTPIDTDGDEIPDDEDPYPNDPNRWKDVPVMQLAVINMSEGYTDGKDVTMVALDDNNKAAFAYADSGNDSDNSTLQVYTWESGQATWNQGVNYSETLIFSEEVGAHNEMNVLTPSGKVYGTIIIDEFWYAAGIFSSIGGEVEVIDLNGKSQPINEPEPPISYVGLWGNGLIDATEDGYCRVGACFPYYEDASQDDEWIYPVDIYASGKHTYLGHFLPYKFNKNGWAIGTTWWLDEITYELLPSEPKLWNGSELIDIKGNPVSINSEGCVISGKNGTGWLLKNGSTTATDIKDLLPEDYKNQIKEISPTLISNADPDNDNTYYVVFNGKNLEGDGSGTWVDRQFRLKISDTGSELAIINLPEGVTANFASINKNGLFAAICQDSGGSGSSAAARPVAARSMQTATESTPAIDFAGIASGVEVETVSFSGTNYWKLKSDDALKDYSAPQWVDKDGNGDTANISNGEHNYPVAYTRTMKPKVSAKFKIKGLPSGLSIKVRATGPDGIQIPESDATVAGEEITSGTTESSTPLPNAVKCYDRKDPNKAFELKWEARFDAGGPWYQIAKTKHTVYVIGAAYTPTYRQETLFDVACRTADGKVANADVIAGVWSRFKSLKITPCNATSGTFLTFQTPPGSGYVTVPQLLTNKNGQCKAWGEFFKEALILHGIASQNMKIYPIIPPPEFFGETSTTISQYNVIFEPDGGIYTPKWDWSHIDSMGDPIALAGGPPWQGVDKPPSGRWLDHALVFVGTQVYDPSFGTGPFTNILAWEDASVDGFLYNKVNRNTGVTTVWRQQNTQGTLRVQY